MKRDLFWLCGRLENLSGREMGLGIAWEREFFGLIQDMGN